MQFLLFHLGKDSYGLRTRDVVRVLPLLELKQLPQAPDLVAGLMNLHGEAVPVIDLCMLACGRRSVPQFDTRIVLVDYAAGNGERRALGLIAERVDRVARIDQAAFTDSGVANSAAPYLGKVAAADGSLLQLVELEHLLPETVRKLLYCSGEAST